MGQHLRALAEPEDVVQETMLGLLRAAGQHGQELTETEVAKLAHIIAANRLRMLGRRVTATAMWREGDGIHLDGIGIASDDPGDLLMHHEGTARLVAALRALPDGEQGICCRGRGIGCGGCWGYRATPDREGSRAALHGGVLDARSTLHAMGPPTRAGRRPRKLSGRYGFTRQL
jgi:hypothetical protein